MKYARNSLPNFLKISAKAFKKIKDKVFRIKIAFGIPIYISQCLTSGKSMLP